jgi:hypothetical protein
MKLKKSSNESAAEESKPTVGGGAFISARHRNPSEELAVQPKGTGDMVGGICAVVATVMLMVITALLYLNWEAIKSA